MKVFLDDIRNPPSDEWIVVRTYEDCIKFLETGQVTELSLDHDLGNYNSYCYTGYDVAVWIEEKVWKSDFYPPVISVHSANPVGLQRILASIESIKRGVTFSF